MNWKPHPGPFKSIAWIIQFSEKIISVWKWKTEQLRPRGKSKAGQKQSSLIARFNTFHYHFSVTPRNSPQRKTILNRQPRCWRRKVGKGGEALARGHERAAGMRGTCCRKVPASPLLLPASLLPLEWKLPCYGTSQKPPGVVSSLPPPPPPQANI